MLIKIKLNENRINRTYKLTKSKIEDFFCSKGEIREI